ncbi:MAG: flavin reductase family protein, partial [Hydrogenobacter sp.]
GYVPRPVAVVCVKDNPFTASHHTPINRNPFLYAVSVQKDNYSYQLLQQSEDFTVNFLPYEFLKEAHLIGKTHGNEVNKWELTKLKPIKGKSVESFMILGSLLIYECKKIEVLDFPDHALLLGLVVQKHYLRGKLKPKRVRYILFHGKNFYSTHIKPKRHTLK